MCGLELLGCVNWRCFWVCFLMLDLRCIFVWQYSIICVLVWALLLSVMNVRFELPGLCWTLGFTSWVVC